MLTDKLARRVQHGDDFMAQAAAEHLAAHLERSSFLVVKKLLAPQPSEVPPMGTAVA